MPQYPELPQNTFVVRFWWERQGADSDQTVHWRGRIEHVQSGEGMTFSDVSQLLAFTERFITPWPLPQGDRLQLTEKKGGE